METVKRKGPALHVLMLAGFLLGLGLGLWVNLSVGPDVEWVKTASGVTGVIGQLFLNLLFMLVIPLLFSAIVMGVSEMGDLGSLGRVGLRTLILVVTVSAAAVIIGLVLVNVFKPGVGIDPAVAQEMLAQGRERAASIVEGAPKNVDLGQFFLGLVPSNAFAAAAANQILPLMVFAIFFGVGLVLVKTPSSDQLRQAINGLFEVMMKLINIVIQLAPIAVACLMFNLSALFGWALLEKLAGFVLVAVGAMAIHMFVVYPALLALLGRMSPFRFFSKIRQPMVVAFSTASSNATLPVALRTAQEELGLPRRISRFVLTVGATANQNGTALFEGVAVLFLCQFFNVDLTLTQQLTVMLVCILGGIGTAGVPAGSLPVVAMILGMVGAPPEGLALILGVDRFLDMCRTTLNVAGDLVVATIVSRGEKDIATTAPAPAAPPAS
jgi:DAACS family dicarboxylate/amino acid:cation (Na+ or H+) symporter